jgi:hypothetical protein
MMTPSLRGRRARNAPGDKPLRLADAYAGLQLASSALVSGTNQRITFDSNPDTVYQAGSEALERCGFAEFLRSDSIALLDNRRLAVSVHIVIRRDDLACEGVADILHTGAKQRTSICR